MKPIGSSEAGGAGGLCILNFFLGWNVSGNPYVPMFLPGLVI